MVSVASMKCGKDINKCSYPLYTCDIWWPVWPSSEPIPFFPPPPCVKTRPSFDFVKTFKPKPKFISYHKDKTQTNVFCSALLMSQLNGNNILYNEEGVSKCELQFWGRLVDKEGLPFFGAVKFGPPKSSSCNSKEFIEINEHIVKLVDKMRLSDDQTATLESRFLLETYLRLPSYSSCAKGIDSLYFDKNKSSNGTLITTKVNTTACLDTDASSKKYAKDPCCNTIEAGANKACRPRPQEIHIPRYVPDKKKVRDVCSTAPCVELVLDNMIEVVQQLALENGASCGKTLSVQDLTVLDYGTIEVLNIYIKCKNQALGDFSVGFDCANSLETPGCFGYKRPKGTRGGVTCWVDEDCPGDWKCDIKNRICQIPREVKEKKLVECLVEKLPSFVLSPLLLKYDVPTDKQEAVEEIRQAWLTTDCVEATDFALQKRETWFYDVFDPRIYELYKSFEIPCTTSVRLDQISETLGDTCRDTYDFGSWYVTASTEYLCMKDGEYCNWVDCKKEGFSETECRMTCEGSSGSSEDFFCGLCFNDEECNVFSSFNSKEQCEEQEVCVLPNGDIIEASKEECENLGQCTEPCSNDGTKCTSKSECEKKGGTCSGWQYFEEPSAPEELEGACFSSFMTYDDAALAFTSVTVGEEQNSAIAALCKQQSQYTPIGCIR
jgi:hypothetical protein